MLRTLALGLLVLAVIGGGLYVTSGPAGDAGGADPAPVPGPTRHVVSDHIVAGADGVPIAITVFRPAGSSVTAPVPLVLHGHGWSGSRLTLRTPYVDSLLAAGYGVLSMDFRGHGDSGGEATLHTPANEIADVSRVLDWAHGELEWVVHQDPRETGLERDLLVGGVGGSYGGAWQLLSAALDGRLDALVPEITWHDLTQSLAPNGAIKTAWVTILYGSATGNANPSDDLDRGVAEALATNEVPPWLAEQLAAASPSNYPGLIGVPTLFVQGVPDTLFNLDQAVANAALVGSTGTDVRLFTHLDGHILNPATVGVEGAEEVPVIQPAGQGSPCGDLAALRVAWFDEHLKGLRGAADHIAPVTLAVDDAATCLRSTSLDALEPSVDVGLPAPIALGQGGAGPSVLVPLDPGGQADLIAGLPSLRGNVTAGVQATVYVSLVAIAPDGGFRVLSGQVTPLRLQGPLVQEPFELAMGGIGSRLQGETLALQVATWDAQFFGNSERTPGAIVLEDLVVSLPVQRNEASLFRGTD